MKKKIIKGLILAGVVFLVLFLFRLFYGFLAYPKSTIQNTNVNLQINDNENQESFYNNNKGVFNIASSKMVVKGKKGSGQVITIDQKYEKVAALSTRSKEFKKDEKQVRETIKKHNALIQFETNSGLKGNRFLYLTIGVDPKKFDEMIKNLKGIGNLLSLNITKKDKTNEYKNLNAKKNSLFKTRASLLALKKRGGKIEEFMNLENRILEIENSLQQLGVKLGEFDDENEFCTVKLTLLERIIKKKGIPFLHRVKVSLEWTVKLYLKLVLILFLVCMAIYFIIKIVDMLKLFNVNKK